MGDQMNNQKRYTLAFVLSILMLLLILDTKTAVIGTYAGIDICLKTIIPSIFPFLVLSSALCALIYDTCPNILSKILYPCGLSAGAETIFVIGAIGGYPLGAKLVYDAYSRKSLTKSKAEHMLLFCNNAGPAFIFGVIGPLFTDRWVAVSIWLIHVTSAYIVGFLTATSSTGSPIEHKPGSFQFTKSLETMGIICGWIILFKILLTYVDHWFLKDLPIFLRIIISGIIELSNGCLQLPLIQNEGLRFLIALGLIALGGSCIAMQTAAIIGKLSLKSYLRGKLLHTLVSLIIALPFQSILFANPYRNWHLSFLFLAILTAFMLRKQIFKKIVAFRKKMIYNREKA